VRVAVQTVGGGVILYILEFSGRVRVRRRPCQNVTPSERNSTAHRATSYALRLTLPHHRKSTAHYQTA
jgi:hypothetical protein